MKKTTFFALSVLAVASRVLAADGPLPSLQDLGLSNDWKLSLSVFAYYGDNRDSVPDSYNEPADERYRYQKEDDIRLGIQPRLTYSGRLSGSQTYQLSYSPVYQYWDNPRVGSRQSEFYHTAFAEYKLMLDNSNQLLLRDDFKYVLNDRWYLGDEDVARSTAIDKKHVEHEQEHYDNTLRAKLSHRVSTRFSYDVDASWSAIRYRDDDLADEQDEDKFRVRVNLHRATSAQFSYGIYLRYSFWDDSDKVWTDRNGQPGYEKVDRGVQTYTIGISTSFRVDPRLTLRGSYGYEYITYESDSIDDRSFPGELNLAADYALSAHSRGTLGARYYVSEGWVYPYASQDLLSIYAVYRTAFNLHLSGLFRVEYKFSDYNLKYVPEEARYENYVKSHTGDKKDLYIETGIEYRYNQNLSFTLTYGYEDVDSDVSTSYHENSVRARATYFF